MRKLSFFLGILALLGLGCGTEKEETKNMEQIYQEEGVPVRVSKVEPVEFETYVLYHATVKGWRESSCFAGLSDPVEKIYVKVGDQVREDQRLMSFPQDNPQASYYQAKAAYDNAEATFRRMEKLVAEGGISSQEFDNVRMGYNVALSNWNAVQQNVHVLSPLNGVVTKLAVQEYNNVEPGDPLCTISQMEKIRAQIWMSEEEVCQTQTGGEAWVNWQGGRVNGKIVSLDQAMDMDRKAFGAIVEFPNPGSRIRCGITVEIGVRTYSSPNSIVVARQAINSDGENFFVYIAEGNIARKREVALGRSNGLNVELEKGLNDGELLVVEGQLLLSDGAKLKIVN